MVYDINLIPKAKVKTQSGTTPFILSVFIVLLAGLLLFVLYFPYQQKLQLRSKIKEQENLLLSFNDTQDTYNTLTAQLDAISQTALTMDMIKTGDFKMKKLLDDIEGITPDNIIVKKMNLQSGLLTIDGTTPTYTDIAKFMVKLRDVENVMNVTFMNAAATDTGNLNIDSNTEILYNFTVYVRLNSVDAFAALQLQNAAQAEGTGTDAQTSAQQTSQTPAQETQDGTQKNAEEAANE